MLLATDLFNWDGIFVAVGATLFVVSLDEGSRKAGICPVISRNLSFINSKFLITKCNS